MSFFSLRDDELFALFRNAPIETINCLCRSHPRISRLSREPRFRQLMEEKMVDWLVEHYNNLPGKDKYFMLAERYKNPTKENALLKSIREGNLLHVNLLLKYGVDPSTDNNTGIFLASRGGHLEIVNRLLEDPRVNPTDNCNLHIISASASGHLEIVNRLLDWRPHEAGDDRRVDPSDQDNDAIVMASERGHLKVVDRLLRDPRVDPSDRGNEAIISASKYGHYEVVNRLLEDPRVDPTARNNAAIIAASSNGHLEVVKRLLDWRPLSAGDDRRVDHRAQNNRAIKFALQNDHYEIFGLLARYI